MVRRPAALFGAAAALVYVAAVGLAMTDGHHHVRPLYEGAGPPVAYQWVQAPPASAASNTVPKAQSTVTHLGPTGTPATGITSADSQLILNLPAGAIASHGSDTDMKSDIVPLDPATLGSTSTLGLAADGNAYRVDMTYEPSGSPVTQLAKPGDLILTVPVPAHAILFAPDGKAWEIQPTQQIGAGGFLGTTFTAPGYRLAGTQPVSGGTTGAPSGSGSSNVVLIGAGVAVLAVGLIAGPILWQRRSRGRRTRQGRRHPTRR